MQKVLTILGYATKFMTFLVVTAVAAISIATAYIMFAPDEFPKPFRLMYNYEGSPAGALGGQLEPLPTVEPTPEPPKPGDGVMFNMSTKIINLADPSGRKYIRLTVVLEFEPDNPEYKELAEEEKAAYMAEFESEISSRMPIMDDIVIKHLSTKTFEELYTAEGKESLRRELIDAIGSQIHEYNLISIYFTEFVVQ